MKPGLTLLSLLWMKEGPVSEIQRWGIAASESVDSPWITDAGHPQLYEQPDEGEWVFFTDHEQAVRVAVSERDREWEARIEELATEQDRIATHTIDDRVIRVFNARARLLRSLLSPVSEESGGRDEVSSDASASGAATNLGSEPTTEKGENR